MLIMCIVQSSSDDFDLYNGSGIRSCVSVSIAVRKG